jgi:hypothetical protein
MAYAIREVDYFYATVEDTPCAASELLSQLAHHGVNLVALSSTPAGEEQARLTLFPEAADRLLQAARETKLELDGPHQALLVQGDDAPGALADIHRKLCQASVNVFFSSGVTSGRGRYGYIVYVRREDFQRAADALAN